jgi:hypothetical protein
MSKFKVPDAIETATPEVIRAFIKDRKNYQAGQARKSGISPFHPDSIRNMAHTLGESSSSLLALDSNDSEEPKVDTVEMTARFVITTAARDRHGDIVLPRGCVSHLKNYTRNPRVFFAHKTDDLPIASARDPYGNLALEILEDRIYSTAYFHGETRESELIFRLVARKELQASSIGFLPIRASLIAPEDDEDLIDLETGEDILDFRASHSSDMPCLRFLEWDMIEWSIVPIPANQDALAAHLSRGHIEGEKISPSVRRALSFYIPKKTKTFVAFDSPPAVTEEPAPPLPPTITALDIKVEKSFTLWDGLDQKQRATLKNYKKMTAWFDGKDVNTKTSYKLPHHDCKSLKPIWDGVRTAMAALLGSQGGIEIPQTERLEVYNHLVKHYKEYYIPAPEYRLLYSIEELKTLFPDIEFKELLPVNTEQLKFKKELEDLVSPPTQGKTKKKKKEDEDEDEKKEVDEDDESAKKSEPEDDDDEVDVKDKSADDEDDEDDEKKSADDEDDKDDESEEKSADDEDADPEVDTKDVLKSMAELMHSMHDCSSAHTDLLTSLHEKMDHCMNALSPKEEEKPEEDEMKTILGALLTLKSNQDALNKRLFEVTGKR